MATYENFLSNCSCYIKRKNESVNRTKELSNKLNEHPYIKEKQICIYLAGSMSRNEYGKQSDIDLFIVSKQKLSKVDEYTIYAAIIEINSKLQYTEFSNDARYLKVYSINDLINATGSPRDDNENLFTARQLLLLEGRPVFNKKFFKEIQNKVLEYYFIDDKGNGDFKPLFLLNDILRYWRTLCLNYEQIRQDKTRLWRKKNINLKYSRKITIFSTILPMLFNKNIDKNFMLSLCKKTPLERFAYALDLSKNEKYFDDFKKFIEIYEYFISAKEVNDKDVDKKIKNSLDQYAKWLTAFINKLFHDPNINSELAMFLIQ